MSTTIVLLFLVASGEGTSPTMAGLISASREALGSAVTIRVSETDDASVAQLSLLEGDAQADATVLVVWDSEARRRADLTIHMVHKNEWIAQSYLFSSVDGLSERGRTLGLAVASLLSAKEVVAAKTAASNHATAEVKRRRALGVSALAVGIADNAADELGGTIEALSFLRYGVAFRAAVVLRGGSLDALPGTTLVGAASAGVEWWLAAIWHERVRFAVRTDVLLLRHQVFDSVEGGTTESEGSFMPGADLIPLASLRLTASSEAVVGVGAEFAFGDIHLRKGPSRDTVATIPALRTVAQAGLRFRF